MEGLPNQSPKPAAETPSAETGSFEFRSIDELVKALRAGIDFPKTTTDPLLQALRNSGDLETLANDIEGASNKLEAEPGNTETFNKFSDQIKIFILTNLLKKDPDIAKKLLEAEFHINNTDLRTVIMDAAREQGRKDHYSQEEV